MAARPVTRIPFEYLALARQASTQGDQERADRIIEEAILAYPQDAELHNAAGSQSLKHGSSNRAVELFRKAVELVPDSVEFRLNLVIALGTIGRHDEALAKARALEDAAAKLPRYWSARANAARNAGDMEEAASSYDRCLALDAKHVRALHGRARVALNRAEGDALARFDQALAVLPSEADLWLGKAQARDAVGRTGDARVLVEQLVARMPHWVDALLVLAQLRANAGESNTDAHFSEASRLAPEVPAIPAAHIRLLVSTANYEKAAEVAAEAAARFPAEHHFALARASNVGMAGHLDDADCLFARLEIQTADRWLQEGRHRLRRGDFKAAEDMLERASRVPSLAHTAYALLGILWRLTDDERADWLHGQEKLVQTIALPCADDLLPQVIPALHDLHDRSSFPVGQSLRGGTQTRHILFHRHEPVYQEVRKAIEEALEIYRGALPPFDSDHPLLRHRDDAWNLAGSWSVRLRGGGDHHASHIHPQGMLSSALYLVVPETAGSQGHLEIGRPPPDLMLDLEPLKTIEPKPGYLALFPSTLFHGTTPFSGQSRMTVAFDVVPAIDGKHG